MGSKLESAMEGLIRVFHSYSSKEGDKYKLSKVELKNLLQGELSDFLAVSLIPNAVKGRDMWFQYDILSNYIFMDINKMRTAPKQVIQTSIGEVLNY